MLSVPALPLLANHLWQSTLFAIVAWGLTFLLRKNRAAVRYGVWLAASIKFLVPFAWLAGLGGHLGWRTRIADAAIGVPVVIELSQPFRAVGTVVHVVTRAPAAPSLGMVLLPIWFFGFGLVALSWLFQWRRLQRAVHEAQPLGLGLPIRAFSWHERREPGVFGIFRPVLLLPEGIGERLTPAQVDTILAHELCHWRRHDNLTAALHMVVQAIFWFHPVVWCIGSRLLAERERACELRGVYDMTLKVEMDDTQMHKLDPGQALQRLRLDGRRLSGGGAVGLETGGGEGARRYPGG